MPDRRDITELPASGPIPAPDTSLYTTFHPTPTNPSYAAFGALAGPLGGTQPFSYNVLFRVQSFGAGLTSGYVYQQTVVQIAGGSVAIDYTAGGFLLSVYYQDAQIKVATSLLAGVWYDLTVTWDGTTASAYLDGGLAGTAQPSQPQPDSSPILLGLDSTDPPARPQEGMISGPFAGDAKRLLVWSTCLSPSDVAEQMWTTAVEPVQAADLVLGYDFTTNPPAPVGSGPEITVVNLGAASDSPALYSPGGEVMVPGQGTMANPGGAAPFSLLAWICLGNPSHNDPDLTGYIFSNGDQTDPDYLGVRLSGGQVVVEFGSQAVIGQSILQAETWHYLGVTWDGATCTIYVDGAMDGSGSLAGAGTPAASAIRLFGILNSGVPSQTWSGYIQSLSLWNVTLTAQQVTELAYEDPSVAPECTADFLLSAQPFVDAMAVDVYGLWDADELLPGASMYLDPNTQHLGDENGPQSFEPRRPGVIRIGAARAPAPRRVRTPRLSGVRPPAVEPFSPRHREMMVDELRGALSALRSPDAPRLLEQYRAEVDRVFDLARDTPEKLEGPYVSYRRVEGGFAIFYHPDAETEVDLDVLLDVSQECLTWWVTFILQVVVGLLTIFGLPTPTDALKTLAQRIVSNPAVVQTLTSSVGLTFTAATFMSVLKVLYDFGYLAQALWLAVSMVSWWLAAKFVFYVVGIFLPAASPQKLMFITNCVTTVAQLVIKIAGYPAACGSTDLDAVPAAA